MRFIGQNHIMRQLYFILRELYRDESKGCNILLKGPSGYGKTEMALHICKYLSGKDFQVFSGEKELSFKFKKRVIFIDEIHELEGIERLYRFMDMRDDVAPHVFVFATNIDGNLPEAFVNRCYEFIFDEYHDDELLLIARDSVSFRASDEQFMEIIKAGNRNPRIIKSICRRLQTFFNESGINPVELNFKELMENIFDIKDGLDTLSRKYLDVLESTGGSASISLLKTLLHVDENSLKKNVEPILIKKGLIQITSKGRILTNDAKY